MTTQKSKVNVNTFDLSKYQIESKVKKVPIKIEETGDEFEVTVKQLYVRECLKAMIIDAPWGRTTEALLVSIDSRLGTALEAIVPKAFGDDATIDPNILKKD